MSSSQGEKNIIDVLRELNTKFNEIHARTVDAQNNFLDALIAENRVLTDLVVAKDVYNKALGQEFEKLQAEKSNKNKSSNLDTVIEEFEREDNVH